MMLLADRGSNTIDPPGKGLGASESFRFNGFRCGELPVKV